MTDIEKKRVMELKENGLGYGMIAKVLNLPKSTVSSFIKSLEDTSICQCCGKRFIQPKGVRKKLFCSDKCRYKFHNLQAKEKPIKSNYEVECLCCHKKFFTYRSLKRKFCSRECYESYRRDGK